MTPATSYLKSPATQHAQLGIESPDDGVSPDLSHRACPKYEQTAEVTTHSDNKGDGAAAVVVTKEGQRCVTPQMVPVRLRAGTICISHAVRATDLGGGRASGRRLPPPPLFDPPGPRNTLGTGGSFLCSEVCHTSFIGGLLRKARAASTHRQEKRCHAGVPTWSAHLSQT